MRSFFLIMLLFLIGCYTRIPINKAELSKLQVALDELKLAPATEIDNFRFDIIRQKYEQKEEDTIIIKKMPYHPLGFDLGNGLFFDLNQNLSFKIKELLDIKEEEDYKIIKNYSGKKKNVDRYRRKIGNQLCFHRKGLFGKKKQYCWEQKLVDNNLEYYNYRGNLSYTIVNEEKNLSILWGKRRKKGKTIKMENDSTCNVHKWKKKANKYELTNSELTLGPKYMIKRNKQTNEIEVYRTKKNKTYLIKRIKHGAKKSFVYNKNYFGKKLERDSNRLIIYTNQTKRYELEKVE